MKMFMAVICGVMVTQVMFQDALAKFPFVLPDSFDVNAKLKCVIHHPDKDKRVVIDNYKIGNTTACNTMCQDFAECNISLYDSAADTCRFLKHPIIAASFDINHDDCKKLCKKDCTKVSFQMEYGRLMCLVFGKTEDKLTTETEIGSSFGVNKCL